MKNKVCAKTDLFILHEEGHSSHSYTSPQRTSWAFSAGTKIIPATKESYRVYIGTSSLNADIYA